MKMWAKPGTDGAPTVHRLRTRKIHWKYQARVEVCEKDDGSDESIPQTATSGWRIRRLVFPCNQLIAAALFALPRE